jgi:hypothetical protein
MRAVFPFAIVRLEKLINALPGPETAGGVHGIKTENVKGA